MQIRQEGGFVGLESSTLERLAKSELRPVVAEI